MKIIVAGSRTITVKNKIFSNIFYTLAELCNIYHCNILKDLEIISGHARGVDTIGEEFAHLCGFKLKIFLADWNKHGKKAGYLRNIEMADYGDILIAFWDGNSKGTKHMIDIANNKGLKVYTYAIS